jgi:hypothetical protein
MCRASGFLDPSRMVAGQTPSEPSSDDGTIDSRSPAPLFGSRVIRLQHSGDCIGSIRWLSRDDHHYLGVHLMGVNRGTIGCKGASSDDAGSEA